jgi:dTDP-4-dehydrorhamnose 3,5-epimerase
MQVKRFDIAGPVEITPQRFADDRGYFSETFNASRLESEGIREAGWPQDNQSYSQHAYTLRGLHFQLPPFAQAKLVRVLRGSILDVAVDIRPGSPGYGKWMSATLTASGFNQLYIPAGFAHGFLTLEPHVEVAYKVTAPYSKAHDRSIRWNDPAIGIAWQLPGDAAPVLSAKDAEAPLLSEIAGQLIW